MALLDADRLFPIEDRARGIARALYDRCARPPIVSPHGHTDPRWYAEDAAFPDPAQLFVTPDHYVFRMLRSQGVPLEDLGVPRADGGPVERTRARSGGASPSTTTCSGARRRGSGSTMRSRRSSDRPSGCRPDADRIYDRIADCLARPAFRPRALFERFGIEVIATTESPLDDLRWHRMIRDSGWHGRVVTAYRPDPWSTRSSPASPRTSRGWAN
jgi:glucuronate isomerase